MVLEKNNGPIEQYERTNTVSKRKWLSAPCNLWHSAVLVRFWLEPGDPDERAAQLSQRSLARMLWILWLFAECWQHAWH
jgi:hypothetical protein